MVGVQVRVGGRQEKTNKTYQDLKESIVTEALYFHQEELHPMKQQS